MSKSNSFSADTLRTSGTSVAVPLPSPSLRQRVAGFAGRHGFKPRRIEALEKVMAALQNKDRMLREKLRRDSIAADKKRLQKDLAITERQQQKGQAMLDQWC